MPPLPLLSSLEHIATLHAEILSASDVAIALSGGSDSMALAHALSTWCASHNIRLHILHVDHALRATSSTEAKQVKSWVSKFYYHQFRILKWQHKQPITSKLQEQARAKRYELLANYCQKQKIKYLFIAHHQDDQAETVLFRLSKSSGIDGLSAMQPIQDYNKHLSLVRPLLNMTHDDLISYCRSHQLSWIEDPSNQSERFARIRLRQSKDILSAEGLTNDRLNQLAVRCGRAKNALQFYTDQLFHDSCLIQSKKQLEFDWKVVQAAPDEIKIRLLQKSIYHLYPSRSYPAPLERLEDIVHKMNITKTSKATLAKCLISWSKSRNRLLIEKESVN